MPGPSGRFSGLVQRFALKAYQSSTLQRVLATEMGRRLFESAYLGYKSAFEAPGSTQLARFAERGWVVDIGANIGFFTLKFARWVPATAKVIAVEPEARNFDRLARRLARSGLSDRVVLRLGAATNRDGRASFAICDEHPGNHRLSTGGSVEVPAWRVDSLVREAGNPHIRLMKVDVQGAEMLVLEGAMETLTRCHPALFIEIDPDGLRSFGTSADGILDLLEGLGYGFHQIERGGIVARSRQALLDGIRGAGEYTDVLALPLRETH